MDHFESEDHSERVEKRFDRFLTQRKKVLEDIEKFLEMALEHLNYYTKRTTLPATTTGPRIYNHLGSLFKSLCLIHALYGYPGKKSDEEGGKSLTVHLSVIY